MPVDPSSQSRRPSRKTPSDSEDIDSRRARGEISCAECRRLKLKCDKKLPCGSCVRRGCPSICPNGSLASGQGTRFVLANTAQLHAKITEMGQRIRQLEDALAIFQAGISTEPHPLLSAELLSIKFGPQRGLMPESDQSGHEKLIESIDAVGTMTIGDRGEAKYFGRSAGSETLLLAGAELEMSWAEEDESPPVSLEIARLSGCFPFGVEADVEGVLDRLFEYLPTQQRASSLCETYMEQGAWAFRPIKREEIINDILSPAYKCLKERQSSGSNSTYCVSPHKLAVLFIVFALGALVDLTLDPYSDESDKYYHLSRAALSLRSIFDSPEMATVQAVVLMGAYYGMGGKRYTMDSAWSLMSLGAKLAQSLGLHRDSSRWNMDPKTVQRRRGFFWELFSTELFYSLALGRPPSIRLSYIDCEFPEDDDATLDDEGNPLISYYQWKYEFARDIFATVTELTLTAETPQYQTVLELDRKVREKVLPSHLNVFMSAEDPHCTPSVYMRGCLLGQYRAVALLYIHRSFFAQAMLDHPVNPLRSPYAPSFLAAYRCASGMIKSTLNHYDRFPELCCRWWTIWTHLFSAAIIVGCIVTRSPSSSMAPSAFIELGLACDLFEKGAMYSRRARSGMAILFKLRERAFQVYSQFRSGNPMPPSTTLLVSGKPDYGDDELALFGGQTRVLVSRLLSSRTTIRKTVSSPTSPLNPLTPTDNEHGAYADSPPDVHPSLMEYLSLFPPQHIHTATHPNTASSTVTNIASYPSFSHSMQPSSIATSYSNRSDMHIPSATHANEISGFGDNSLADPHVDNDMDLGMVMSGESGMDEQWISFMRDSGLLDASLVSTMETSSS
ncbi:fungal-specific transcription factor domain-containing protein [Infundibulicybe gibba]|nr:fungal-specific transcription factor domain-containing protein [Infundibulicybe gibba]